MARTVHSPSTPSRRGKAEDNSWGNPLVYVVALLLIIVIQHLIANYILF